MWLKYCKFIVIESMCCWSSFKKCCSDWFSIFKYFIIQLILFLSPKTSWISLTRKGLKDLGVFYSSILAFCQVVNISNIIHMFFSFSKLHTGFRVCGNGIKNNQLKHHSENCLQYKSKYPKEKEIYCWRLNFVSPSKHPVPPKFMCWNANAQYVIVPGERVFGKAINYYKKDLDTDQ